MSFDCSHCTLFFVARDRWQHSHAGSKKSENFSVGLANKDVSFFCNPHDSLSAGLEVSGSRVTEYSAHTIPPPTIAPPIHELHGFESHYNCHKPPDLAPIENFWQLVKQALCKYPHWDDATIKELISEGQRFINEKISSMPERLQAVLDREGEMTRY